MTKLHKFKKGDQVFAKVKGYPPWPAIVLEDDGKKYKVKFYGTGEIGKIGRADLNYYRKNKDKHLKFMKRKDYNDALNEIEKAIKITGTDGDDEDAEDTNGNESLSSDVEPSLESKKRKRSRSASSTKASDQTLTVPKKPRKSAGVEKSRNDSPTNNSTNGSEEDDSVTKNGVESNGDLKESKPSVETEEVDNSEKDSSNEEEPIVNIVEDKDYILEIELEGFIAFGEYVEKNEELYSKMQVEDRTDSKTQVLPIFSNGKSIGILLHENWPIKEFANEYERALYDKNMSQRVMEIKKSFKLGRVAENPSSFVDNLKITEEDLKKLYKEKLAAIESNILDKLTMESKMLDLNLKIREYLSLEKAEPKEAIKLLKEILSLELTPIMLKKHAHVVDMVRRLRKYVGNMENWNFNEEEKKQFRKDAEEIRGTALKVYVKFMHIIGQQKGSEMFWDSFNNTVTKFREEVKILNEEEFHTLTCEPYSRENFLNNFFIKELSLKFPTQNNVNASESDAKDKSTTK